jgi:uncharacterized membrane protein HdeD (DUF308 family)
MTKASSKAATAPTSALAQRPWWLTLILGIAAIVVGALLLWGNLITKIETYFLLVTVLGVWWLVDGIFDIVGLFIDRSGWGWKLFVGLVSIIAGGYILLHPIIAGVQLPQAFVLVLGIWGVVKGALWLVLAFKGGGGAYAIIGLFALFFGLTLIAAYGVPGLGVTAVWVAAIFGLVGGFFQVYRALQQRKA